MIGLEQYNPQSRKHRKNMIMVDKAKYDETNPLDMHNLQFDIAAGLMDIESWILEKIKYPRRELSVKFPLRLDNGKKILLNGYRVQHNTLRGPGKGGIRLPSLRGFR